jgi:hypothetical protein
MTALEISPHPLEPGTFYEKPVPQATTHVVENEPTTAREKKGFFSGPSEPLWKDLLATILVLLCQVAFFFGVKQWKEHTDDTGEPIWGIYGFKIFGTTTNCDQLKHQRSALSLTVNVIAAVVTLFTPGTLQVLSAPTRRILDECHRRGKYMEIGVPSFRNMVTGTHRWGLRFWLWTLLFLIALPFHLL